MTGRLVACACWIVALMVLGADAHGASRPVCAKRDAKLYKDRSTKKGVSWTVSRYMPFLRTQVKGSWSRVEDLEGVGHWARNSDLTTSISCVVVKRNVTVFRSGPSTKSPPMDLRTLDRYTPLKKVNSDREWIQVQDETGRQGWIHESQVWKPVIINSISF